MFYTTKSRVKTQITYIFKYARVMPDHRNSDKGTFSRRWLVVMIWMVAEGGWGGWGWGRMVQWLGTPGTQRAGTYSVPQAPLRSVYFQRWAEKHRWVGSCERQNDSDGDQVSEKTKQLVLEILKINSLKSDVHLNYIYKFISRLLERTASPLQENHPVNII